MTLRTFAGTLALWLMTGPAAVSAPAAEADRLDRFRQLATSRLGALELSGSEPSPEVFREIYAILDEEVLESLKAGSVFASAGFLQEQLDAFGGMWGGSAFRIFTLPAANLTVGSFQLSAEGWGSSVRVYRRAGTRAELLTAIHRSGIPHLYTVPPTRTGADQILVVWVGPASPRGTRALQIELWRQEGDRVRTAWSTVDLFGPHLYATAYEVRGREITVRYEARYPGWKPGCEDQTEQEDHYRYVPASETFVLARRETHNGWHRELHATVERLLVALSQGDQQVLSALGLAPELRRELPSRLEPEPACDILDGPSARIATVSATAPGDLRRWALRFQRTREGWRFTGAGRIP